MNETPTLVNPDLVDFNGDTLAELMQEIRYLRQSHDQILALITEIKEQVGPTIETLKNSPILKMMGV